VFFDNSWDASRDPEYAENMKKTKIESLFWIPDLISSKDEIRPE
jgi:hypothetical protein